MATYSRFAVLVLASLVFATSACQLPPLFPEIQVNTSDPGENVSDDVAIGEDGEFIVAWSEFEGADGEVLGRRYNRLTTPQGDPFPLNASTTNDQLSSSIARDAEGRFVAVWMDESTSIWGRRFDADGTPLGGNFQVNTSTPLNAAYPHVASDPSGNFVVAWTSLTVTGSDVMARRFDSNGAPLSDEFPVNQYATGFQRASGIAMSPAGFVVAWAGAGPGATLGGTETGIFARLFNPNGTPATDDIDVHTTTAVEPRRPDVAMNAKGDFVVVWDDGLKLLAVEGRRFFADSPPGDVFTISLGTLDARDPQVASDSSGNFLVSWIGIFDPLEVADGPSVPAGEPIPVVHARLYDIGGFAVSTQFQVSQYASDYKFRARPSITDDGSFVIAWTSSQGKAANDVKARKTAVRAAPEIFIDPPLEVGSAPSGGGAGNFVLDPGESEIFRAAWTNDGADNANGVSGTSPLFTGPPGADYTLDDATATYDTLTAGQTTSCILDCYAITVSDPVARPVQHWDALLQETLDLSIPHTWVIHIGESFPDVPLGHQFYFFVENLFHNRVTGGCAGGVNYCPGNAVTRAQMAVFLLKSKFGSAHIPPPCTGTVFNDVPCTGAPFDPWIEELFGLGITGGCGSGNYCPNNPVTRQQMAVFLLKALEGSTYVPTPCSQTFDDVPCPSQYADWIQDLFDRDITNGCSVAPPLYCPTNSNNRGQMAAFLVKTFGLVLYGG